jgi:hypothetical protein
MRLLTAAGQGTKKADVVEPKEFNHVGLLFNELPATAGGSLSSHPTRNDA